MYECDVVSYRLYVCHGSGCIKCTLYVIAKHLGLCLEPIIASGKINKTAPYLSHNII